jgi:hypothetical protein
LLHVNFLFSCALRMIVFVAFRVFTFDCSSAFIFLTNKAFIFKSLLFDVLNALYTDITILLLKIALRDPYSANIMNPYIMTDRYLSWVCRFHKVIVITFFLFFTFLPNNFNYSFFFFLILGLNLSFNFFLRNIFLFLLIVWTFFRIFIISRISFLEKINVNVNVCPFHGSSFNITKWTR